VPVWHASRELTSRCCPQVVVDTKERPYLRSPVIAESALPSAEGQQFAYRYRGWRLLIQKGDRMFLVPCRPSGSQCIWRPGSPMVPLSPGDATAIAVLRAVGTCGRHAAGLP
jgi:hypothetical protein